MCIAEGQTYKLKTNEIEGTFDVVCDTAHLSLSLSISTFVVLS